MATRSLSPDRIAQKLREHRSAVAVLAMQSAKRAVKDQIRAKGKKPAHFTAKEIAVLAEVELQRNRTKLIAEAEHAIATWPGFAPWRLPCADISTDAQKENEPRSITSAVQMSGAQ